jgi:hypothetical protein
MNTDETHRQCVDNNVRQICYAIVLHLHVSMTERGSHIVENWRNYLALVPPGETQNTIREMGFCLL